ncbi:MAG: signal recognition particle protein Srp19 [Methanobacteriota archaeon]|nr:MAG: signal recognition particle protein Srp19 [Euryarchaeota archaeon]
MIIYPSNIDQGLSKREGRKVPRKNAVPSPKAHEILKALQRLGIEGSLEKDACYPRRWWEREGRVVVDEKGGKRRLLKRVAREIRQMRASSGS